MPSQVVANTTDCHFHVLGPSEKYDHFRNHVYDFEAAPLSDYLEAVSGIGVGRYVLVQPSIYGRDNRCLLDTLGELPKGSARGVVAISDDLLMSEIRSMHELGVRGVRFNLVQGPNYPSETIRSTAERVSPLGWHLEVYVRGERLAGLQQAVDDLPCPLILDHMGHIAVGTSDASEQLSALRCLLDTGKVWVKLIAYRLSVAGAPFEDVDDLAQILVGQYSSRCLWGTDWPSANFKGRAPTPSDLRAALDRWAASDSERNAILVDNPAQVYGFEPST